jgi:hypothetical protein
MSVPHPRVSLKGIMRLLQVARFAPSEAMASRKKRDTQIEVNIFHPIFVFPFEDSGLFFSSGWLFLESLVSIEVRLERVED